MLIQASRSIQGAIEKTKQLGESPIILQEPKKYKPPSSKVQIEYCAKKNPLFKTHLGYKIMQQKPKMDFEDGFFVAHNFVFGNKHPPSKPIWDTRSCHKNPRWILKMGFCLLHTFGNKKPIFKNLSGIQNYGF
jgi:hypothetical protein